MYTRMYVHVLMVILHYTQLGELIELKNIYGVHRPVEDSNFTHQLDNEQLLLHSSPVSNDDVQAHPDVGCALLME